MTANPLWDTSRAAAGRHELDVRIRPLADEIVPLLYVDTLVQLNGGTPPTSIRAILLYDGGVKHQALEYLGERLGQRKSSQDALGRLKLNESRGIVPCAYVSPQQL
jgi:hypothetical protein